jgi:hypothetical protein
MLECALLKARGTPMEKASLLQKLTLRPTDEGFAPGGFKH